MNQIKGRLNKSLLNKFRLVLLVVYIISLIIVTVGIGVSTRNEVYTSANKELSLLVDMVKAARTYIAEDMRPVLMERNVFHPPGVSSTVATKHIASHFLKAQPSYYIKTASDNPLNLSNRPEPLESKIIEKFRAQGELKELIEEGIIKGQNYLVSSRVSVSKESCLRCHGTFSQAPPEIQQAYTEASGFGYIPGQVVGASFVGVPISNINSLVFKRITISFVLLTTLFSVVFILIDALVRKLILQPVKGLANTARQISEGIGMDQEIITKRRDEIGELSKAFELMRRSLVTSMNKIAKLRNKNKNDS